MYLDGLKLKKKVRAIVTNEAAQLLLIRPHGYDDNSWTFLGGGVESGESEIEALYRELREEANIEIVHKISRARLINWFAFSEEFKNKKQFSYDGQHASYFHVSVPNKTSVKIQESEVADFCWCRPENVSQYIKVSKHLDIFYKLADEFNLYSARTLQ
ncbi:MAG: NUDIX hydrolase [Micavibrio sp.]